MTQVSDPGMDPRGDAAVAAAAGIFGVVVLALTIGIREGTVVDPIGTRGLPAIAGAFLVVAGLLLSFRRFFFGQLGWASVPAEGTPDEPGHPASSSRPAAIVVLAVAYTLAVPIVGFPLATPVFMFAMLTLMEVASLRRRVGTSVIFTLAAYIATWGLSIYLPLGPLAPVMRWLFG